MMIHNKKAQGISINAIIIAAVALIVLVVLVAIFTGKFGDFSFLLKKTTGDPTKNCADQDPNNYELTTVEQCKLRTGASIVSSVDSGGNLVCCTKKA